MATGGGKRNDNGYINDNEIASDDEESAHLIDNKNKNSNSYDSTKPVSSSLVNDNSTIQ